MNLITNMVLASSISSSVAFMGIHLNGGAIRATALDSKKGGDDGSMMTRRETLESWFVGAAAVSVGSFASPEEAAAFPNKISNKYDDRPKQKGSKPQKLGVATRKNLFNEDYQGLKPCGNGNGGAPNCFCSTDDIEDSPETNIPPFKWPSSVSSREDAFQQLYEVVKAYEPGQNEIDGGGFEIVTFDPKAGYIYAQFQSLKNGFIDDVEFAVVGDGKDNAVQLRSSSRLGFLDYGVNAIRVNYFADALQAKGWKAPGVELKTHQEYAAQNGVSGLLK